MRINICLLVIGVLVFACTKNADDPLPSQNVVSESKAQDWDREDYRYLYHTEEGMPPNTILEMWCEHSGGNCHPIDIVISGAASQAMVNFENKAASGDLDSFFQGTEHKLLFDDVPNFDGYLSDLISGTLTFKLFVDDIRTNVVLAAMHDSADVVTYKNASSTALMVVPFQK